MTATISLKKLMARSSNVALDLIQFVLAIAAFLFFVGMAHLYLNGQTAVEAQEQESGSMIVAAAPTATTFTRETQTQPAEPAQPGESESPA